MRENKTAWSICKKSLEFTVVFKKNRLRNENLGFAVLIFFENCFNAERSLNEFSMNSFFGNTGFSSYLQKPFFKLKLFCLLYSLDRSRKTIVSNRFSYFEIIFVGFQCRLD